MGVLPDHPKWMHPHVSYPNALPVQAIMERLTQACSSSLQEFWPDDVSLLDGGMVEPGRIHGPRQLSDIYLLALAIRRKGRFVTFDTTVPLNAVKGARKNRSWSCKVRGLPPIQTRPDAFVDSERTEAHYPLTAPTRKRYLDAYVEQDLTPCRGTRTACLPPGKKPQACRPSWPGDRSPALSRPASADPPFQATRATAPSLSVTSG